MRKMKGRDGHRERETARRKNEEMEVKGQEEGGEGSSDPSQPRLLKCVCMCYFSMCVCVHDYVSVCALSPVYMVCGLFMYVCLRLCLISHAQ